MVLFYYSIYGKEHKTNDKRRCNEAAAGLFQTQKEQRGKGAGLTGIVKSDIEDPVLELADVFDELAENFTDAAAAILALTADLRKDPRDTGKTANMSLMMDANGRIIHG